MNIHTEKYLILDTILKSEKNITATEISEKSGISIDRTKKLLSRLYADGCILHIKGDNKIGYSYRYLTMKGLKIYGDLEKVLEAT